MVSTQSCWRVSKEGQPSLWWWDEPFYCTQHKLKQQTVYPEVPRTHHLFLAPGGEPRHTLVMTSSDCTTHRYRSSRHLLVLIYPLPGWTTSLPRQQHWFDMMALSSGKTQARMVSAAAYDADLEVALRHAVQGTPHEISRLHCDDGDRSVIRGQNIGRKAVAVLLDIESDEDKGWERVADAMTLLRWHGRARGIYKGLALLRWGRRRLIVLGEHSPFAGLLKEKGWTVQGVDVFTGAIRAGAVCDKAEDRGERWTASQPSESCTEACARLGSRCDSRILMSLNHCDSLKGLLGCRAGCGAVDEVVDEVGRRMKSPEPQHHHPSIDAGQRCTTQLPRYADCAAWAPAVVRGCGCSS